MRLESVYKGWNNTTPRHTSVEPSCCVWPLLIADPAVAFLSALTHSSKSSFTSHTVFNFWGIQPPTASLFLQLNLLTVSSCLLPNPSPYSLSFIPLCCFFYLCSLIFLSLGPRFLLHLFIYLSMEPSISTCSDSKNTCWWYLSAVRKAGYCSKWGRIRPLT